MMWTTTWRMAGAQPTAAGASGVPGGTVVVVVDGGRVVVVVGGAPGPDGRPGGAVALVVVLVVLVVVVGRGAEASGEGDGVGSGGVAGSTGSDGSAVTRPVSYIRARLSTTRTYSSALL